MNKTNELIERVKGNNKEKILCYTPNTMLGKETIEEIKIDDEKVENHLKDCWFNIERIGDKYGTYGLTLRRRDKGITIPALLLSLKTLFEDFEIQLRKREEEETVEIPKYDYDGGICSDEFGD